jgi:hypothetical protein
MIIVIITDYRSDLAGLVGLVRLSHESGQHICHPAEAVRSGRVAQSRLTQSRCCVSELHSTYQGPRSLWLVLYLLTIDNRSMLIPRRSYQ